MMLGIEIALVLMVAYTSSRYGNNKAYTAGGIRVVQMVEQYDKVLAKHIVLEMMREAE